MKYILVTAFVLAMVLPAAEASAKTSKFTFNDVMVDEQVIEIEAGSKSVNKGDFTKCSYYSNDYAEYLGAYESDAFASADADEVLDFCVENFGNRTTG